MILTPAGKIARYFFDLRYPGRDLRLGLVEASANKIGSPIDQVLLFCFHYDPSAGKYGVAVMNFVRLGGVLTMVVLGGIHRSPIPARAAAAKHTGCKPRWPGAMTSGECSTG